MKTGFGVGAMRTAFLLTEVIISEIFFELVIISGLWNLHGLAANSLGSYTGFSGVGSASGVVRRGVL